MVVAAAAVKFIMCNAKVIHTFLLKSPFRCTIRVFYVLFQHPWLQCASDKAALTTPAVIKKNNSARELSQFAESAMAVNRVVQQHFSMKLDYLEVYPDQKERGTTPSPQYSSRVFGLSPPSESDLMRRRLKQGRSCQYLVPAAAQAITSLSG